MKIRATLGYTAAIVTMLVALLTPLLYGMFSKGFAALGLHVDEVYSGSPVVRSIPAGAYTVAIHRVVYPHMLQSEKPFVQIDWTPAAALGSHISDLVDIDGDGRPDVRVSFDVPTNPKAPLHVDVDSFSSSYESMRNAGKEQYSRLIARVDNTVLVRIPLRRP
jgi:hypothetical protein